MRASPLLALGMLLMVSFVPSAAAVEAQCVGVPRGDPDSDDYECVGMYFGNETCIGVYHKHPNPDHPDGCNAGLPISERIEDIADLEGAPDDAPLLA